MAKHVVAICVATAALLGPALGASADSTPTHVASVPILRDGSSPVLAADFNGDGHADLAVATPEGIALYVSGSDGGLPAEPTVRLAAPHLGAMAVTGHQALAAGDLNEDGKPDFVLTEANAARVVLFLSRGDDGFAEPATIEVRSLPSAVAVADLNGDSHADVAVVSQGTNSVLVLFGTGTGAFSGQKQVPVGFQPSAVVIGDFGTHDTRAEPDGKLDLAVTATGEGQIALAYGKGDGDFAPPVKFPAATATGMTAADMNADGAADLISLNAPQGTVSINLGFNKGAHGSFGNQATVADLGSQVRPQSVAAVDLDGDGKPDLAIAVQSASSGSGVFTLLNRAIPRTGLMPFERPRFCGTPGAAVGVVAADFSGSGVALDLAVTDQAGRVSLFFGDGKGGVANCAAPRQLGVAFARQFEPSATAAELSAKR